MCGCAREGVLEKTSLVDTYRFDPKTREFGVKDAATGNIINYFKATRAYYARQPGI